jgi:serine/threonine protein kinase
MALIVPSAEQIVAFCQQIGPNVEGVRYGQHLWIKHREAFTETEAKGMLEAEVAAQRFAYAGLRRSPVVRVPQIHCWFQVGKKTYIVMDFIDGTTYSQYRRSHSPEEITKLLESIADAVRRIWKVKIPPRSPPGPFGRHEPADRFFSCSGVGRTFDSLADLQDFINKTLEENKRSYRVDFTLETLSLCHCDLAQHNIRITSAGVVYLLDFGMAGLYPTCFDEYALAHQSGSAFARRLRQLLFGDKASQNAMAMAHAARLLW